MGFVTMKGSLVLLLASQFIVGAFTEQFILESPRVTDWGEWGLTELCPPLTFVYGMRMKVQPASGILVDDTALNGIELLCASPLKRKDATENKEFASITSTVGHRGAFGTILECPVPGYALGFVLRSEENQLIADDSAANDLILYCSTGTTIGGYNATDFGDWTVPQVCPRGLVICGIQTQVEGEGNSDETTLNNVNMVCCDPTEVPPTEAPPTEAPPTEAPPTEAPPTEAPPTEAPPTEAPPTEAPPTEAPPTEAPPTEAPPTEAPPTDGPLL